MSTRIHPTAHVEPTAQLGVDVEVGPFAYIGGLVTIGDRCRIHHHATVEGNSHLGEDCEVFPYAYLGGRTQDKKWTGEEAPVHIGKANIFREFCTVHPATFADRSTRIGDRNLFCAYSHIGHECTVGSDCVFSNNATLGGHVVVGDAVVIGGLTAVHQFCRIGSGAMIGGCCKVLQDILPNALAEGYPVTHRSVNTVGMQRRGLSEDSIRIAKQIHKVLFRKGLNRSQALEVLRQGEDAESPEVGEVLAFIALSQRGLA
ncbi:MAG: hypothetical protein RL648_1347 [Verrucomicrobiota bacterium]|jgi:UDP-N-acetylglucosamine acyltransferase